MQLWHQGVVDTLNVFAIGFILFRIRIASLMAIIMGMFEYTAIKSGSFTQCARKGCVFVLVFFLIDCLCLFRELC